ncbi:MAG: glycosyltransferase [Eggerthellaceae bacterium]|nr:glycosyltransferase [Eggerthellaceae bacterium]
MNPLIIIPTYVSARRRKEGGSILTTYDHTTSINQKGELGRCLESLCQVENLGLVMILVVSERSIEGAAVEKVHSVTARFPQLSTVVVGAPEMALLHQRMEQLGLGKLGKEIGLVSYGAIRNTGLVLANALGFDSVVFLDDDEVVDDPGFLRKAVYGLGKLTKKGAPILAKTGYYLNEEGTYRSLHQDAWYNHFWQQGKAFNEWIEKAMRGPRLSRSNHVCGGCLAIHKEAFKRVAFDAWIPRGEDLDYLLNLRMYGSDIWFDNQWSLHHLPPATPSEGNRFRQDIYRWLYEYRKMEYSYTQIDLMQVKPSSLEPYPGPFLEPGITRRIRLTAFLRSLVSKDKKAYRAAAKAATSEAATYARRNCSKYFEFQEVWPELMARMENDAVLREALVQSVAQRSEALGAATCAQRGAAGKADGADELVSSGAEAGRSATVAPSSAFSNIDPGLTSEIRLNMAD